MHVTVDAKIAHGNACDVEIHREGNTAVVELAADPHGGPECLWFCFRLRRDAANLRKRSPLAAIGWVDQ